MTLSEVLEKFYSGPAHKIADDDPGWNGLNGTGYFIELLPPCCYAVLDVTEEEIGVQVFDNADQMTQSWKLTVEELEV